MDAEEAAVFVATAAEAKRAAKAERAAVLWAARKAGTQAQRATLLAAFAVMSWVVMSLRGDQQFLAFVMTFLVAWTAWIAYGMWVELVREGIVKAALGGVLAMAVASAFVAFVVYAATVAKAERVVSAAFAAAFAAVLVQLLGEAVVGAMAKKAVEKAMMARASVGATAICMAAIAKVDAALEAAKRVPEAELRARAEAALELARTALKAGRDARAPEKAEARTPGEHEPAP